MPALLTQPTSAALSEPESPPNNSGRRYLLLSGSYDDRIRIAILDDHPVITLGIAAYLRAQPDFDIVHIDTEAETLLQHLDDYPCDVALIDFYLPHQIWDGVDFIRRLRRRNPDLAIITFSAGVATETEYASFRAGATGYVPKVSPLPNMVEVIRAACSPSINGFITHKDGLLVLTPPEHPDTQLTLSEIEILRLISQGLSVTQISGRLLRSKKTVSTHKRRAMRKLGVTDDLSLALYLKEKFEKPIAN